ncbi:MAG: hypothetical protein WA197_18625 [Candidatus Acidiferrales bacterium]
MVALCERNQTQTEEFARVRGMTKVYNDFQQMVEAERFDTVVLFDVWWRKYIENSHPIVHRQPGPG